MKWIADNAVAHINAKIEYEVLKNVIPGGSDMAVYMLYVYKDDKFIYDSQHDGIKQAKKRALTMFDVSQDAWKQLG